MCNLSDQYGHHHRFRTGFRDARRRAGAVDEPCARTVPVPPPHDRAGADRQSGAAARLLRCRGDPGARSGAGVVAVVLDPLRARARAGDGAAVRGFRPGGVGLGAAGPARPRGPGRQQAGRGGGVDVDGPVAGRAAAVHPGRVLLSRAGRAAAARSGPVRLRARRARRAAERGGERAPALADHARPVRSAVPVGGRADRRRDRGQRHRRGDRDPGGAAGRAGRAAVGAAAAGAASRGTVAGDDVVGDRQPDDGDSPGRWPAQRPAHAGAVGDRTAGGAGAQTRARDRPGHRGHVDQADGGGRAAVPRVDLGESPGRVGEPVPAVRPDRDAVAGHLRGGVRPGHLDLPRVGQPRLGDRSAGPADHRELVELPHRDR